MSGVKELEKEYIETDVLVVGGGIAGTFGAVHCAERGINVTLISKSRVGRGGCSIVATNLLGAPDDAFYSREERKKRREQHEREKSKEKEPTEELTEEELKVSLGTMGYTGAYIANQQYPLDAQDWTRDYFWPWIEEKGIYVRRMPDGRFISNTGPVHAKNVWAPRQGQTPAQLSALLRHEVYGHKNIRVIEECILTSLLKKDGKVTGAVGLGIRDGRLYIISAKATALCTGMAARLTVRTTATGECYGGGWVAAYRAGAELSDLEMFYLHAVDNKDPLTLNVHCYPNPNPNTDKTPHMYNSYGEFFFTPDMYRQGYTAMYHLQYKAIVQQIMKGKAKIDGGYFSGFKHMMNVGEFESEYQWERSVWDHLGYHVATAYVENAVNFEINMLGGVNVDLKTTQSSLPGLYAAGAVAGGGHTTCFNFCAYDAWLFANSAEKRVREVELEEPDPEQVRREEARLLGFLRTEPRDGYRPELVKTKIREIMTDALFPWKNEGKLKRGLEELKKVREEMMPKMSLSSATLNRNDGWISAIDADVMLCLSELLLCCSLERKESRQAFFRDDYPYIDNDNWLVNNIVKMGDDGKPVFRKQSVDCTYVKPKPGKLDYFKETY